MPTEQPAPKTVKSPFPESMSEIKAAVRATRGGWNSVEDDHAFVAIWRSMSIEDRAAAMTAAAAKAAAQAAPTTPA